MFIRLQTCPVASMVMIPTSKSSFVFASSSDTCLIGLSIIGVSVIEWNIKRICGLIIDNF